MRVDEAVDRAAREVAVILAGRASFYGEVTTKYQDDRIVQIEIRETLKLK